MTLPILKLCGMALLMLCSVSAGFFKSYSLTRRTRELALISSGLAVLGDRIVVGGERERLLKSCFSKEVFSGEKITASALDKEDFALFSEFLNGFGSLEKQQEKSSVSAYRGMFLKRLSEAEIQEKKSAGLYKTLGFCFGLCGCIFLF